MDTMAAILLSAGIPSAIFACLVRRLEKKIEEKDEAREEHEYLIIKSVNASIALGEATAKAVQRIPDAHCNGDMHAALDYAVEVKHEQKEFLSKQALKAIN